MTKQELQNNTYRTTSVSSDPGDFTALTSEKRNTMRMIVENFFSYVKQKHS